MGTDLVGERVFGFPVTMVARFSCQSVYIFHLFRSTSIEITDFIIRYMFKVKEVATISFGGLVMEDDFGGRWR